MNKAGHPATLVASQPGNSNRLAHGLYSKRQVAPEVCELADELMRLPHVAETDYEGESAELLDLYLAAGQREAASQPVGG